MTQGERIKYLRKEQLNMTLEEFGKRVGVQKASMSRIERGINGLTEQMSKSICREYNVSEEWLKNGDGEIFIQANIDDEIACLIASLRNDENDSFKKRLLAVMANLTEDQWEALAEIAENLDNKRI